MSPLHAARLLSRAVLAVSGPEAKSFLNGLITNDIERLSPSEPLYAGLLSPQGKLLVDFLLFERDGAVLIDVDSGQAASLAQRLVLYKLRAKVVIETRPDWAVAALWGAAEATGILDPRHPGLGARIIGPNAEVERRLNGEGHEDAFTRHRLALGIGEGPEIGDERTYPLEANFEPLHGVDFKKGCYVGQELTARMKHRGGLRKRVLPFRFDGAPPPAEASISGDGKEIGTVLVACDGRGLALVRLDRLSESDAALDAGGTRVHLMRPDFLAQNILAKPEGKS